MRSIGFLSEKGGVGKSTIALNCAHAMAKQGSRVLFIDADPQSNATMVILAGGSVGYPTLANVLANECGAGEAIRETATTGLDLIPADSALADVNVTLASELGRERRLRLAMQGIDSDYDFIVVDTSPQRCLININVLNYVAEVYCPVDPGIFALAGLLKLQDAIAGVVKYLDNPTLHLAGLLLSRVQRDNLSRDTEAQLREAFGPLVLKTTIPASTKIGEAHARYASVLDFAPASPGAKAFLSLTSEIIKNGALNGPGNVGNGTAPVNGKRSRRARAAG